MAAGPHPRRDLSLTPRRGFPVRGAARHPSAAAAVGAPVWPQALAIGQPLAAGRSRFFYYGSRVQREAIRFASSPGTQMTTTFAPPGPVLCRTLSGGLT
jgi:hypothetical protein